MIEQGIEDTSMAKNLGILFLSIVIIALFILIYFLITVCNRKYGCIAKLKERIKEKLFYNTFIRYMIVSYLKLFNQMLALLFMSFL